MSALWDQIELSRHGVIEAHAGTGKTYTIVQLVLRILRSTTTDAAGAERPVHIREILLVTFTEKAAGELKKRIREGIEKQIADEKTDSTVKAHLEDCLNNLHEALIGTIHAICLRLLQTWPFESGVPFTTEIVSDAEGIAAALRESMRTDWQDPETALPWACEQLAAMGIRIEQKHFDLLCTVAKELLDDEYVQLDRTLVQGWTLQALQNEHSALSGELNGLRGSFIAAVQQLLQAIDEANNRGMFDAKKQSLVEKRLFELHLIRDGVIEDGAILRDPVKCGRSKLVSKADLKRCPELSSVVHCSEEVSGHAFTAALAKKTALEGKLLLTLINDGAELLARRWQRHKLDNGLLSYQDMLRLMRTAVSDRPSFTAALRKKLRFAIIDEFQDTSRLQWEVFKQLFLADEVPPSPRLYIVGDPKQSIYSFQGADVHSYLDAKQLLQQSGHTPFELSSNYRSCAGVIQGYNALFAAAAAEDDWFLFGEQQLGISYTTNSAVVSPSRTEKPGHPLALPPLQAVVLEGSAAIRKQQMATAAARAIKRLIGTTISVPDGTGWKSLTLAYEDFAVIVENHKLADPFLETFREEQIPAVKYKMEGVFQSPMARALHAVLTAVLSPSGNPAPRLAALLTPFFNRPPESIDPEHDLEPCGNPHCHGNDLCIAHALQEWTGLAGGAYWSQLFDRLQRRTGIYERLIRLGTGERQIADLRQVIDYCIELLYCEKYTLSRLVEHLGSLLSGKASAGEERNLHVLETQKSSVKVLTMHAAKGLEFPVVFVATGTTRTVRKGPNFLRFTESSTPGTDTKRRIKVAPFLSSDDLKADEAGQALKDRFLEQAHQERRRLLYVALTRAQAMLFVPLHLARTARTAADSIDWMQCERPVKGGEHDLTPKLQQLLAGASAGSPLAVFNPARFPAAANATTTATSGKSTPATESLPDIVSLALQDKICRQTSYTQISRHMHTSREIDRSEEMDEPVEEEIPESNRSPLPGGQLTGDALHCALEDLLVSEDIAAIVADPVELQAMVDTYLGRNGIYTLVRKKFGTDATAINSAVTAAMNCVKGAVTTDIPLPGDAQVQVAQLNRLDRKAEMEFLLKVDRHWVHGFMDLVFRIENPEGGTHHWRYYVLDWKSDSLAEYTASSIRACIERRHYDMQATLYSHALDRYLRGILGEQYNPTQHLGGAIYLFLREHEREPLAQSTLWTYRATPEEDARYIEEKVAASQW